MQHFAFSDLHGSLSLYKSAVSYMESIPDGYHAYYLGDAADRGEDGYAIMKLMMDNPNITYLYGNHEDLLVKGCRAFHASVSDQCSDGFRSAVKRMEIRACVDIALEAYDGIMWIARNGGLHTFTSWIEDGAPMTFVNRIAALPVTATYGAYDMCHAGCKKRQWEMKNKREMIWNRDHFDEPWYDGRTLIHGHTPTRYLRELYRHKLSGENGSTDVSALSFSNGSRKIDVDVGAFDSSVMRLYCLDTGESKLITG